LPELRLAAAALAIIGLLILTTAGYPKWRSGWSYGPRLLTDTVPWFALLAILGLAAKPAHAIRRPGRVETADAMALVALSVAMNAREALSYPAARWSAAADIDDHPERVFNLSYPEFLAGLIPAPDGWHDPGW